MLSVILWNIIKPLSWPCDEIFILVDNNIFSSSYELLGMYNKLLFGCTCIMHFFTWNHTNLGVKCLTSILLCIRKFSHHHQLLSAQTRKMRQLASQLACASMHTLQSPLTGENFSLLQHFHICCFSYICKTLGCRSRRKTEA